MPCLINVDIKNQSLDLLQGHKIIKTYPISSGKNGCGEVQDSECTPRGLHRIHSKIGAGAPINSVFVARRWTGEVFSEAMYEDFPGRDWILTRILRLEGMELGFNRGIGIDSLYRFIYIHGTPEQTRLQVPGSRGCIRMNNLDLLELFELVSLHSFVHIYP